MIIKDRDPSEHRDSDDFARSGAKAEQQMAHYLRRAFADDKDVLVLHDLRLEVEDETKEALQIDHLVIHRHGLILIESKSVTGRILVNEHGEWVRTWSGGSRGMQSPVLQAQRQADLLRKALNANAERLVGKVIFGKIQKGFKNCPMEIIVAISDQGIIERKANIPELCKADQVPGRVKEIVQRHLKAGTILGTLKTPLSSMDGVMDFPLRERQNIAAFLVEHHYPLATEAPEPPPPRRQPEPPPRQPEPKAQAETAGSCPRCGSPLVQRTARKGAHVGSQFWGCTAFPKCRYMSSGAAP